MFLQKQRIARLQRRLSANIILQAYCFVEPLHELPLLACKPSAVQALSLGVEEALDLYFEQIVGIPVIAQAFGVTSAFSVLPVA
ncbi:hypothetical protein D3C77_388210 [compost metagenome]